MHTVTELGLKSCNNNSNHTITETCSIYAINNKSNHTTKTILKRIYAIQFLSAHQQTMAMSFQTSPLTISLCYQKCTIRDNELLPSSHQAMLVHSLKSESDLAVILKAILTKNWISKSQTILDDFIGDNVFVFCDLFSR